MAVAEAVLAQVARVPRQVLMLGTTEQMVLLHVAARRRAVLGPGAARVVELCNGSRTVAQVVAEIAARYQVSSQRVTADTLELLAGLVAAELVELVDERRGFPLETLVVELTERCNLHCRHCIFGYRVGGSKQIPADRLQALLDEAAAMGARAVVLTGGEPTLHPAFSAAVHQARRLGLRCTVLTNGIVPAEPARDALRQADEIRVSLDGATAATHDRIRGRGSFARAVATIKDLVTAGANVGVTFTACQWNKAEWSEMPRLCAELGVKALHAGEVVIWGRAEEFERELGLSTREVVEFRLALGRAKVAEHGAAAAVSVNPEGESAALHREMCVAGRQKCTVLPDGRVIACSLLDQPELAAGNIHQQSLQAIWQEAEVFQTLRGLSVTQFERCGGCDYRFVCGGGCRAFTYLQQDGDFQGPPCPADCGWRQMLITQIMQEYPESLGPMLGGFIARGQGGR